jgi:threonine synthase
MMRWQQILASSEGLYVEPASAAGLVAVEQLARTGRLGKNETVVSLLTASGLKDPAATAKIQGELITVPSDFAKATDILKAAEIFPNNQ